jgi:hypothetical protein
MKTTSMDARSRSSTRALIGDAGPVDFFHVAATRDIVGRRSDHLGPRRRREVSRSARAHASLASIRSDRCASPSRRTRRRSRCGVFLRRAVDDLLGNAVKHALPSATVELRVAASSSDIGFSGAPGVGSNVTLKLPVGGRLDALLSPPSP